jgi:AcrR family transcriptional regulator
MPVAIPPSDAADSSETRDGRVLRGARNRLVIVEALLELVRDGEIQPTAEQVAKRAGVGTRTVFRHFDDMESLYAEMDARVTAENLPLAAPEPKRDSPLRERVQALVHERVRIFERIAPFKRAGNLQRPRSRFLQERHSDMNRRLRADAAAWLAPELDAGPESLLDAIELLTSFEAWDRLRSDQRLGRERASRVIEQSVHCVLAGYATAESQVE